MHRFGSYNCDKIIATCQLEQTAFNVALCKHIFNCMYELNLICAKSTMSGKIKVNCCICL